MDSSKDEYRYKSNVDNQEDLEIPIRLPKVSVYIKEFLQHLYDETGFKKSFFTAAGLQEKLRSIAKQCYQSNINSKCLGPIFKLVIVFVNADNESIEIRNKKCISILKPFLDTLEKVVLGLITVFVGNKVAYLVKDMTESMCCVIITAFYFLTFIFNKFAMRVIAVLKNWILSTFSCEKVKLIIERLFDNIKQYPSITLA